MYMKPSKFGKVSDLFNIVYSIVLMKLHLFSGFFILLKSNLEIKNDFTKYVWEICK